jgi:hypothetical protein
VLVLEQLLEVIHGTARDIAAAEKHFEEHFLIFALADLIYVV